jgi:enoyl-CoA hydratase/carnithine racemase
MEPALIYEKKGHIAHITLKRPEVGNAMSPEFMVRLAAVDLLRLLAS